VVRHTSREDCNENCSRAIRAAPEGGEIIACSGSSLETPGPKAYARAVSFADEDMTELLSVLYQEYDLHDLRTGLIVGDRRSTPVVLRSTADNAWKQASVKFNDSACLQASLESPISPLPVDDSACLQASQLVSEIPSVFVAESEPCRFVDSDFVDAVEPGSSEVVSIPLPLYHEFTELVQAGDYFNACRHLSDAVESSAEDIPIRDSHWYLLNKVPPPQVQTSSPAYEMADWKFADNGSGAPSPNFWINCTRVIEAACATLNLLGNIDTRMMTNRERKQAYRDVTWNPYVIYATNMKDFEQAPFLGNENYFRMLYLVRNRISLFGDYGYKSKVEGFVGEGAASSNVSELFSRIQEKVGSISKLSLSEIIEKAVNVVWSAISGILELITNAYKSFLTKVRSFLKNFIIETFDLGRLLQFVQSDEFKQIMFLWFVWTMFIFFVGCTVISYNTAFAVVSRLRSVKESFYGQADVHPATFVATLAAGVFGLTSKDEMKIASRARYLCTLVAGGTVAANLGACCFSLLPEVLRDSLEYKFGTAESRTKREANQWRATANALIHLSTVPRVVSSEVYIGKVKEAMAAGSLLLNRMTGNAFNSLRSASLATFIRLQKIHMNIVQFVTGSRTRDEPFCVHIFGRPGIGKSVLEKKLQARAFGIMPHESYPMSFDDEHHSGYMNHRSVVIDEFLVGPQDLQEKTASIFLKLKSSAKVKLDMPTIDNVFVGVKGAEFDSEFIFTMSNTAYPRVASFEASAIQRRRDVVVEFEVAPGFERHVHGSVKAVGDAFDLSGLAAEVVRETKWVKARCLPNVYRTDWEEVSTPWMDFDTLCQYLRDKYEEKVALSKILSDSMSGIIDEEQDPMDLINEELRKTCSLPGKPVGVVEALGTIFSFSNEEFVAEAGPARHYHRCAGCGERFRHNLASGEVICNKCGVTEICLKGSDADPFTEAELVEQQGDDRVSVPTLSSCTPDAHFHPCLNPRCDAKRACNSNRNSLNWICDPCREIHGDKDVNYFRAWSRMNHNAGKGRTAVVSDTVFTSYEDWQQCCAERILLDLGTVWDALPASYELVAQDTISNMVRKHVLIGLALGAMFGLAKWLATSDAPDSVTFQPESDPRKKYSRRSHEKSRWARGERYLPEAKKSLQTGKLDVGHCVMNCIPIAENWVLTFAHGLFSGGDGIALGAEIGFHFNDQSYRWKSDPSDFIVSREDDGSIGLDVAFVRIGDKRCPAFKNVLSCFMRDDEVPDSRFRVSLRTRTGLVMTYASKDVQDYSYEGTRFRLSDGFRYDAGTTQGDCGTPLLMASGDHITKCVGIHVAGSLSKSNPVGLSVRVSREMIEDAIGDLITKKTFVAESYVLDCLEETDSPNLVSIEKVPLNARVHLSSKTKLKPSCIAEHLPFVTVKEPAILSQLDPRSQGKDPVDEAVIRLAKAPKVTLDQEVLELCAEDLFQHLDQALDYGKTGGLRELSFEEAVFGIPGALSSVVTSTNAGSPYCYFVNKTGKRELIWFEGSEGKVNENFKRHVLETYHRVRAGEPIEKVFLGFQKDEVRSQSKIADVNTRITYSNDVTYNVVCRMLFGSMVVAFNGSFPSHGYALGINPSSHDANKIYHRVRENPDRLVAGDFREFDLRHQRQVMDMSFKVLERLGANLDRSNVIFEHVRVHETTVPFIIGQWKLRTECNNASGGFWTTILNCVTAELYFRYGFKKSHPGRVFEKSVSVVILGDDHILSISEGLEWNPLQVRDAMKLLGQEYTSAVKDRELTPEYESFDQVLFLGHYFVQVAGSWSGALRKSTLEESVLWTRNKNRTIVQECQQMMEYASQWDKEYFEWYCASVNEALERAGLGRITLPPWKSLRRTVAERTTENSTDFRFVAQADSVLGRQITGKSVHTPGLVTIDTATDVMSQDVVLSRRAPIGAALSETPGSMDMGTESFVRRGQWNWTVAEALGSLIAGFSAIELPYGLLGMGDQANIQNMGFQNFQFSGADIEIKIQLNGSPTQTGCLIAFFTPLSTATSTYNSWPSLPHVKLSPCDNATGTLRIPFRYWRTLTDNQLAHDTSLFIGSFRLAVYSPLVSVSSPQNCGVTIFSRFVTTQRIPRTLPPSRTNTRPKYGFTRGTGALVGQLLSSDTTWVAQGGNVSTTNVQNTYSVGDVAGNMPIEGRTNIGGNTQSLDQKADVSAVPLDNPPVVGGGIPIVNQFPSMSKSNGPETTTGLYLHPQEMFRQPFDFRDSEETTIANLLARPGRIYNFSWTTSQADGTDLYSFDLDSLIFDDSGTDWTVSWNVPANIAILNLFKFAHFDVVFSVHVVRTRFHSGRLQAAVSYSMFDDAPAQKNALYTNVLDFNADKSVCEFRVPWNSAQEFIRTSENRLPNQSSRIGSVALSVLNELRVTSEVVAASVDVIIEVRFENARLAMPNPYPSVSLHSDDRLAFVAQSEGAEIETEDINAPGDVVSTTATRAPPPMRLCRINLGQKFEYEVGDVHELVRRYTMYPHAWITNVAGRQPSSLTPLTIPGSDNRTIYRIPCRPASVLNQVFAGWSGMQKFRIYAATAAHCTVSMSFGVQTASGSDIDYTHVMTLNRGTVTNPAGLGAILGTIYSGYMAREVMYPIGSQSFIDVSVPFSSELNFVPTQSGTTAFGAPRGVGYLYVNVPFNTEITVYWAAGDDFRYHVFSPRNTLQRKLGSLVGGALPTGEFQIAGIYATPS